MKKFLVLYRAPVGAREQMNRATPEQAKAGMDAWMAWANKAGKAIVDLGMPLGNPKSVRTSSGPIGDLGGYSILQAEDADALAKLLGEHPHFMMPGATLEIHEALPLPGM